jgi:hypothetical protein
MINLSDFLNSSFTGESGFSGYSGYSGQDGVIGTNGQSGFSGYSGAGQSGFSGYSGAGQSGFSGYSGLQGVNGDGGGVFSLVGEKNANLAAGAFVSYGNGGNSAGGGVIIYESCVLDGLSFKSASNVTSTSEIEVYINGLASGKTLTITNGTNSAYISDLNQNINSGDEVHIRVNSGSGGTLYTATAWFLTGGAKGTSGYSGNSTSGFSGYSGNSTSGFSGYSGNSTSGFSGYSGFSGRSGFSGSEYVPLYGTGDPPDPTGLNDGVFYFKYLD